MSFRVKQFQRKSLVILVTAPMSFISLGNGFHGVGFTSTALVMLGDLWTRMQGQNLIKVLLIVLCMLYNVICPPVMLVRHDVHGCGSIGYTLYYIRY